MPSTTLEDGSMMPESRQRQSSLVFSSDFDFWESWRTGISVMEPAPKARPSEQNMFCTFSGGKAFLIFFKIGQDTQRHGGIGDHSWVGRHGHVESERR